MSETVLIAAKTAVETITTGDSNEEGTAFLVVNPLTGALLTEGSGGGSSGGDASAENQALQLAQETAINTALGTVTASPTANTVLARLKDILTNTVLAAGSAIIGKVGIDQTTPGTTDSVTIKSGGHSYTVTFTRPSDTTAYSINDAIGSTSGSAILAFTGMCRSGGGEVIITSVELEVDVASSTIGATTLRLYNASPTAIADNAAWDIPSGDRGKYLGKISIGTPIDEGSTLFIGTDGINKQVTMTGTTLYAVLTTDTAFTPASATVKRITIHTLDV